MDACVAERFSKMKKRHFKSESHKKYMTKVKSLGRHSYRWMFYKVLDGKAWANEWLNAIPEIRIHSEKERQKKMLFFPIRILFGVESAKARVSYILPSLVSKNTLEQFPLSSSLSMFEGISHFNIRIKSIDYAFI